MQPRSALKLPAALGLALALAAGAYAHQASGPALAAQADQTPPAPELAAQGRRHFEHYCQNCHAPQDGSLRRGPDLTGLYGRALTPAMRQPVTDANLSSHIQQGGPRMPPFPWLDQAEIAALLAYLKTI